MQQFLRFQLGSCQVPIVLGHFAGGQHAARAGRVCTHCDSVTVADEAHQIWDCLFLCVSKLLAGYLCLS